MTRKLSALITDAQKAYQDAAATYRAANINQQVKSKPDLDKAASLLRNLQLRQLDEAIEVDTNDIENMKNLRQQVNNAASLQTGLTALVSILTKFI